MKGRKYFVNEVIMLATMKQNQSNALYVNIISLTPEMRLPLYDAISRFLLLGEEPTFDGNQDSNLLKSIWNSWLRSGVQLALAERRGKRVKPKTDIDFVEKFLSPDTMATAPLKREFIYRFIKYDEKLDVERISKTICMMPYPMFLKTPYWRAVRQHVINRDGCCVICGSTKSLHVHHLNYQHHGDEVHHLEDLVCVCNKCHKQIHKNRNDRVD